MPNLGENMTYTVKGSQITIVIDCGTEYKVTDKGNSLRASSKGNQSIVVNGESVLVGCNAFVKQ